MVLQEISGKNFRNYNYFKINCSPRLNILTGRNAQGKTNLLEAISVLTLGHSFKTRKEAELIKWNAENYYLKGVFQKNENYSQVEVGSGIHEKKIKINGNQVNNKILFSHIPVVIFSPDDLQIIKGSPQLRRNFIDLYLAQLNTQYRYDYYNYLKVLKHRNRLLKLKSDNSQEMEIWTEQLIEKGVALIRARVLLLESIKNNVTNIQAKISDQKEEIQIEYLSLQNKPVRIIDKEYLSRQFREEISKKHSLEKQRGISLVGPHRDDMRLNLSQQDDLRYFGSQGQQRTAILSLKIGLIEKIKEIRGLFPILLLDDVMSEFDDYRRQFLLELLIPSTQTFLTATSRKDFPNNNLESNFFYVEKGMIKNE